MDIENLYDPDAHQLYWKVDRDTLPSGYIIISDELYNQLISLKPCYITVDADSGLPRPMTADEMTAYDQANPNRLRDVDEILDAIFASAQSVGQWNTFKALIRKYGDFPWYLYSGHSYDQAFAVITEAFNNGDLDSNDWNLVVAQIPGYAGTPPPQQQSGQ